MAELQNGKLVYKGEGKNRKRHLVFTTKKGGTWDQPINPDLLSDSLRSNQDAEVEVQFELDASGRPLRIRPVGEDWKVTTPPAAPRPPQGSAYGRREEKRDPRRGERRDERRPQFQAERSSPNLPRDFHNPYNFVPAPPRKNTGTALDDAEPAGHDRYQDDLWSGRIVVRLTTQSPLLILDAARAEPYERDPEHKIFPTRVGADGLPYLPPTSIKGMLRSTFEAVTNSRLAIFEKHKNRLAYRMSARGGKDSPVPARVEQRNGTIGLRILQQVSLMGFAAKLPRYQDARRLPRDKGESYAALTYPDRTLPQHGDAVWVQVNNSRVHRIERRTDSSPPTGSWQAGWVCVTGPNINRKRFERVFIEEAKDDFIPITNKHKDLWRELVQNYQEAHERDLKQRQRHDDQPQDYLGDQPGKTGWSRHIYNKDEKSLCEGTLCYVEFVPNRKPEIAALIPVTISRRLYAASPDSLLDDSLKPAQSLNHLSPAERVFGWVRQDESKRNEVGAYRGNLRIGPVRCISPEPVEHFKHPGVPLAILGQPKPQQTRFYVAQSKQGEAQHDGISKEESGYSPNKGLRGRKVYPHHAGLPEGYWDNPLQDRTQQNHEGFFQEYRRPHQPMLENAAAKLNRERTAFELKMGAECEQRDDQNRSILGWVKPQTIFVFEIDVTNLSSVELGALLWLLELPEGYFHRLGGGKPLGFGSVRLTVEETDLRTGAQWQEVYFTLDEIGKADYTNISACTEDFMQAVATAYGNGDFNEAPFIAAFKRGAKGFTKPIHYPRAMQNGQRRDGTIPPHPEGKAFEWFVANEREERRQPKFAIPLSDLVNDEGIPVLETR